MILRFIITTMSTNTKAASGLKKNISKMDKNLHFLTLLDKKYQYAPPKNINIRDHQRKINDKINALDTSDQQEWAQNIMLKCMSLHKALKAKEVVFSLRMLIKICNQNDIEYEVEMAEAMLKEVYYQKYGKEVLEIFKEAGYSIGQFQILEYKDPWLFRVFNSLITFF